MGVPAATNLLNLQTVAIDKSLDLMRETETGPNKKRNMNDYVGLGILVIALIISLLIAKKDCENWYDSDGVYKSYIIRAIVIISLGIILLLWKLFKS